MGYPPVCRRDPPNTVQAQNHGRSPFPLRLFFASFVLPLLTIPYLTRVLGKHAWGQLVFVQGFCLLLGVPLAWGFGFHGTRLIARHRDDRVKVGTICSEITMARIFLLLPVGLILILCVITIPGLHSDLRLPLVGFAAVAINSFSPSWILQGLDQMRFSSALDLTTKLIASLPVFLLVSSPDHAFVVFLLQACGGLVALVPGYRAVCRQVQLRLGFTRSPLAVCRESSGMFLFSLSGAFVNQANVFVFGLFAPMQAVGIYAGAEKIIRAATALVGPFSTALHTKINYRIAGDRAGAARLLFGERQSFCHGGARVGCHLVCERHDCRPAARGGVPRVSAGAADAELPPAHQLDELLHQSELAHRARAGSPSQQLRFLRQPSRSSRRASWSRFFR